MLTMYCVFREGNQSVWFKFLTKEDYDRIRPECLDRIDRLRATRNRMIDEGVDATGRQFLGVENQLKALELNNSYRSKHVDLSTEEGRPLAIKLYRACRRARKAAEVSAAVFAPAAKLDYTQRVVITRAIGRYFGGTGSDEHLLEIHRTFDKIGQGLGGDQITISDNCGRERVMSAPAEGIVSFKPETQLVTKVAARGLSITEKNDLMRHYLEHGETHNIRIEFSLTRTYTVDQLARAILHEASHKFGFTGDYAYEGAMMANLDPAKAIHNADSYAYAGMSMLIRRLVTKATLK